MRVGAIILAGGQGSRFGDEKKQFFKFHGKMLYEIVYDKVSTIIERNNIVVVGVDIPGGVTRSQSVINGLNFLKNIDKVIILEAARPLVTIEQINYIISQDSDSITFVMPCVNSPIYRNGNYIDRKELYDLLVPQCFNYNLLKKAYETGKYFDMTDETRVMYEEHSIKPDFLETTQNLYKVTYKRDIAVLENIYLMMEEGKLK